MYIQDDVGNVEDAEQTITATTEEGSNNLILKSSAEQTETAAMTTRRFRAICFNNIPIPSTEGSVQGSIFMIILSLSSSMNAHLIRSMQTTKWLLTNNIVSYSINSLRQLTY